MANTDGNTGDTHTLMGMNAGMMMNKRKKTTQGRKKIEIKKIDNVSNRQVTFSKRRGGLFKKASELCILTGAEVAIIVQSSGKRIYAFGHPSVDGVIDRYMKGSCSSVSPSSSNTNNNTSMISAAEMREYNLEYDRLCQELEAEKRKLELQEKGKLVNHGVNSFWWDDAIDHLGLEELEQYAAALEELRKNVLIKADELALLKNSQALGMKNNVDLNQTRAFTISSSPCEHHDDDLVLNNQTIQYCPSSSSAIVVPYASDFHFGNQLV